MTVVATYIAALNREHRHGDAKEHSYRGYQVLEKWLKDRKGRQLDFGDIAHDRKIATALARTRQLMSEVDAAAKALFASAQSQETT